MSSISSASGFSSSPLPAPLPSPASSGANPETRTTRAALAKSAATFTAAQEEKPEQPIAIEQVSTPAARAEEAVQEIENGRQLAQELLRRMECLQSMPTMAFLKILDVANTENSTSSAFWSVNQADSFKKLLLLNNADRPVKLFIPAENNQPSSTITSPITFQGAKSTFGELAPERTPTAEENRTIRKMVQQAFEAFYGHIDNQELQTAIQSITSSEKLNNPMTVKEVSIMFAGIPENVRAEEATTLASIEKFFPKEELERLAQLLQNKHPIVSTHAENCYQSLTEPEKYLAAALYHSAETIVRGAAAATIPAAAGAALGATGALTYAAGAALGNPVGSALGGVVGSTLGGGIGFSVGGSVGAVIARDGGAAANRLLGIHHDSLPNNAVPLTALSGSAGGDLIQFFNPAFLNLPLTASAQAVFAAMAPAALLGGAAAGSLAGVYFFTKAANDYFKPGDALQKAREALLTLGKHEEQVPQILEQLQTALASHKEVKTSLHSFFERLQQPLEAILHSSSPAPTTPNREEAEKQMRILNNVKTILISEIDRRAAETQDLITRLNRASQRRAAQKQEHATWKGTNSSERIGPQYRRPGI